MSVAARTSDVGDVLRAIVAGAEKSAIERERAVSRGELEHLARAATPRGIAFRESLSEPGIRVIAECKRRSPSKGVLRADYDPVAIALSYERAGAAAISVLTEPSFFDGSLDHLRSVRQRVSTPLLRKDFIVSEYQIAESRAAGADAILLIVAALDDSRLKELIAAAGAHSLAALVEVHSHAELERAVAADATIIGVNSRDLRTLSVDVTLFDRLIAAIPDGVVAVAESGLSSADQLSRLSTAGFDAFLIGERFMTAPDPGHALAQLRESATRVDRTRS